MSSNDDWFLFILSFISLIHEIYVFLRIKNIKLESNVASLKKIKICTIKITVNVVILLLSGARISQNSQNITRLHHTRETRIWGSQVFQNRMGTFSSFFLQEGWTENWENRTSSSVNCDHLTRSRNSFKTRAERAGIKAGRAANVCFSSSLLECRALNVAWDGWYFIHVQPFEISKPV